MKNLTKFLTQILTKFSTSWSNRRYFNTCSEIYFMNMPISSQKWPFFSENSQISNVFLRYQWDFAQSHLVWMAESASTWKRIMNAPVQTSLKEKTAKILRINANFQITNVQVNRKIILNSNCKTMYMWINSKLTFSIFKQFKLMKGLQIKKIS